MAKEKEKTTARILYVEQGKTAKEIHHLLGVSEKTISTWVNANAEAWKKERISRMTSPSKRIENIRQIIGNLADRRILLGKEVALLEMQEDIDELDKKRKEISQIDDAVSKWNRTLRDIDHENKISLSAYLHVMDDIFEALKRFDAKAYYSLLKFQEIHLNEITNKLA